MLMYFFLFQVSATSSSVFRIVVRRKNEMDEVIKVITTIKFSSKDIPIEIQAFPVWYRTK